VKTTWYTIIGVNPQPWAIGPLSVGRKDGKVYPSVGPNMQLRSYQEAVREALRPDVLKKYEGPATLTFYFQREIEMHRGPSGRKVWAHEADSTNLQKALEDALQGVLIGNDREDYDVRSVIMSQGRGVTPLIVIKLVEGFEFNYSEIPQNVWDVINNQPKIELVDNVHDLPEDFF
jgi:hypothetical protein